MWMCSDGVVRIRGDDVVLLRSDGATALRCGDDYSVV